MYSGDFPGAQVRGELFTVEPWSANPFKWRVSSPAHAEIRTFQQSDARIKNGRPQAAHVRRWIDPRKSGFFKRT